VPYRDTFTVTQKPDGSWEAKVHGLPVTYRGKTASECLQRAGEGSDKAVSILNQTRHTD